MKFWPDAVQRKARIAQAFSAQADAYESVGAVQREVAARLAGRIAATGVRPAKILEIGCGTGFLSRQVAAMFPHAALLLTDIAPAMLAACQARMGNAHRYLVLDGEHPALAEEKFDLIVSSLAVQWFGDLQAGLARLAGLLAPGGRLIFAMLGAASFAEWRAVHDALGLAHGTPDYPVPAAFPWPEGVAYELKTEVLTQYYASGREFARSLKSLGAGVPKAGHRPVSPGSFRRVLAATEGGFEVTYQVLYGVINKD